MVVVLLVVGALAAVAIAVAFDSLTSVILLAALAARVRAPVRVLQPLWQALTEVLPPRPARIESIAAGNRYPQFRE